MYILARQRGTGNDSALECLSARKRTSVNTLGLCTRPMRGAALRDTRGGAEAMCAEGR